MGEIPIVPEKTGRVACEPITGVGREIGIEGRMGGKKSLIWLTCQTLATSILLLLLQLGIGIYSHVTVNTTTYTYKLYNMPYLVHFIPLPTSLYNSNAFLYISILMVYVVFEKTQDHRHKMRAAFLTNEIYQGFTVKYDVLQQKRKSNKENTKMLNYACL